MEKSFGKRLVILAPAAGVAVLAGGVCLLTFTSGNADEMKEQDRKTISLPEPRKESDTSVEQGFAHRRSVRRYSSGPLTLQQVSQLCWAAAGETTDAVTGATRTYPSAGGIYPGELYVAAGNVEELATGIYRYDWRNNHLVRVAKGDYRKEISAAALGQRSIREAPVTFIMTGHVDRTTKTYGKRGEKLYVPMEAGCSAQNIHLQCESLDLGTVILGAFHDDKVRGILKASDEQPLWLMPVGELRKK